jgi:excisionase family DNA binding protein
MSLQSRFKKPVQPAVVIQFNGPRLLTLKEAAQYISHCYDFMRDMVNSGEIPYVPKGDQKLVDRLDLDKWIEKNKVGVAA